MDFMEKILISFQLIKQDCKYIIQTIWTIIKINNIQCFLWKKYYIISTWLNKIASRLFKLYGAFVILDLRIMFIVTINQ